MKIGDGWITVLRIRLPYRTCSQSLRGLVIRVVRETSSSRGMKTLDTHRLRQSSFIQLRNDPRTIGCSAFFRSLLLAILASPFRTASDLLSILSFLLGDVLICPRLNPCHPAANHSIITGLHPESLPSRRLLWNRQCHRLGGGRVRQPSCHTPGPCQQAS
jgi:hypothetical protein